MTWRSSAGRLSSLRRAGHCTGGLSKGSADLHGTEALENRDAREWDNFRSIFHPEGAFVYTTWTGRTHIDDFIQASRAGMEKGAFIMHRIHGTTVDVEGDRAVCKMKATITQRFDLGGVQADAESDCRFCFFFERYQDAAGLPAWGAKLVRHWYEKDKLVAVDPRKVCGAVPA